VSIGNWNKNAISSLNYFFMPRKLLTQFYDIILYGLSIAMLIALIAKYHKWNLM